MPYPVEKALPKARTALLLHRRWAYLRYLHMREGLKAAGPVSSVLAVGCGRGVAEVALALEFPQVSFHLTDIESARTPNYQQAQAMVSDWDIPNVTFGVLDVLAPGGEEQQRDLVMTVEVLEHIEDHRTAAAALSRLARRAVFTLVPFADEVSNADPQRQKRAWEANEHYRVGYDRRSLEGLFPRVTRVSGAYWSDAGLLLRQRLQEMTSEEIRARSGDLQQQALNDLRSDVPDSLREAAGIWCLSRSS